MARSTVVADWHRRLSGISHLQLVDAMPGVLATVPTETSSNIEAHHALRIQGTPLAEPPAPDAELQSVTIGGMQYSTGLSFEPNDCYAKAGIGLCNAIEDAFLDLARAGAAGQLSLLE
jgi:hypothetical protein